MANLILSVDPDYMQDSRLDLLDKLIMSYVTTWEQKRQVCYAKDGLFTQIFGEPQERIMFSMAKLESLHLLLVVRGNGGRVLQTVKLIKEDIQEDIDIFDNLY